MLALLVFLRAEVLDLLAAVLHLSKAQGGRGAFEEVAESGELSKIFLLPARWVTCQQNRECGRQGASRRGPVYRF